MMVFTAINRDGDPFLWPVRLPKSEDDKDNDWNRSQREAAVKAKVNWVRMTANQRDGRYSIAEAAVKLPDPKWPETSKKGLLKAAFKDRFIDSWDHPVLKKLRGEA